MKEVQKLQKNVETRRKRLQRFWQVDSGEEKLRVWPPSDQDLNKLVWLDDSS